jgi:hypothetical protein
MQSEGHPWLATTLSNHIFFHWECWNLTYEVLSRPVTNEIKHKAATALQCKSNVKLIAALLFIPFEENAQF